MSAPCTWCGVRPDTACKHRAADPDWHLPVHAPEPLDRRTLNSGGGRYRMPKGRL